MTAPTAVEIAEVDAGVNDVLVDAVFEDRDPDQYIADLQDDRDRCAYRGDFDRAEALHQVVLELRDLDDRRIDDVEIGS